MGKVASIMLGGGGDKIRDKLIKGIQALNFETIDRPSSNPHRDDLLLLWNRLPTRNKDAEIYEKAGAKVVIAENGWIGKDTYAICLNHHNGAGYWRVKNESRWPSFGIEVKPWRTKGEHILVVPQRGIGVPPVAMPRDWTPKVLERLSAVTSRPIVVRYPEFRIHPIEPEFRDAWAVVTWASGAGIKAIASGIPVFYEMPKWIGGLAARMGIDDLENPYLGERDTMFHALSWAMWRPEEIERGDPFRCLSL